MAVFTLSVFINRSPQEVFDFLSRPEYLHHPTALMQSAAWISREEPGVGSTGRGITKPVGQETELQPKVTQWDPPNLYAIRIPNVQFPFESMQYVYTLEPEDGGTRVTLDCESEWVRFP